MEYKVTMPILSDTMDKGKIIKWYVKEGDFVKKGNKLVEVESDKATMDIESFVNGKVKKILAGVGEEVPVKSVIAVIETEAKNNEKLKVKSEKDNVKLKMENGKLKNEKLKKAPEKKEEIDIDKLISELTSSTEKSISGNASPAAKQKAKKFNIDIEKLQNENALAKPAHEKDIDEYLINRYFTKKAAKLIKEYNIDIENFKLNHKIRENEVLNYIKENNIAKITKLSPNQLAVVKNVENSITKPTFFMFDEISLQKGEYKLTAYLIKALANTMQKNPLTRSILKENKLLTYPSSNISVAVARDDGLFMCVIKNAEDKSLAEINDWLKEIKTKRLTIEDLTGSTFGLSNLGMFKVKRFTALINDKDAGIMAVGSLIDGKMKVTFTFDHRIINGTQAAKFVNDLKVEIKEIQ
ncbi:pyruvate dehydrogenase E2 component [Lebetimonas natsushimae]|uniref:Dihydrolipoamide acetyltransferase component of pyruvate dehydrogenase complex n=1 Tax=Lebetimonas natsushimae TaxID=1936991 RepID=A0A292Y994_9BACT|nr:dihydrolipoamide acetyltransferase family protein [Lebetimonas natsushimae]GAX87442.1 pyruvate dehydrogenase E2 component [Lebetimonas natsushimae]